MMQITFRKSLLAALLSGTVAIVTPALASSLIVAQNSSTGSNAGTSNSVNGTKQTSPTPGTSQTNPSYSSPATNPDNFTGNYGGMNNAPPQPPSQTMMKNPSSSPQPLAAPYGNSAGGAFGNTPKGPPSASTPQTTQPHR